MPVLSARVAEAFNQLSVRGRLRPAKPRDESAFIQEGRGSIRGRGGRVSRTLRPDEPLSIPVGAGITGTVGGGTAGTKAATGSTILDPVSAGKVDVPLVRKPGSYAVYKCCRCREPECYQSDQKLHTRTFCCPVQTSPERQSIISFHHTAHTSFSLVCLRQCWNVGRPCG